MRAGDTVHVSCEPLHNLCEITINGVFYLSLDLPFDLPAQEDWADKAVEITMIESDGTPGIPVRLHVTP